MKFASLVLALGLLMWMLVLTLRAGPTAVGQPANPRPFLSVERALESGDQAAFAAVTAGLQGDPLLPYLRYAELKRDLDTAPDAALESFLAEFPDTPPTERVRAAYVKRLAQAGRWADLLRVDQDDDAAERRCWHLRALMETGQADAVLTLERLGPLWLVPRSQPAACDPLFSAWRARGGLTADLIWQRIRLALAAGETGLARTLAAQLPEADRPWLTRWLAIRKQPAGLLGSGQVPVGHPLAGAMLADGIDRLARVNPRGALTVLDGGRAALAADQAAWGQAQAAVGQALDRAGDPQGLAIWDRMSERADNLAEQERRLRAGLARRDWRRVAEWVRRMPDLTEKRDRWLYWQGRAQAALGQEGAARETLAQAARQRSLWGLLAADRLGLPYALEPRPVPAAPDRVRRIAATPGMARIAALNRLGRDADMRREWRLLTRAMDPADLMAAAVIAHDLGWYDQAIFTLARTDYWDDLELRFPLAFRDQVEEQAWQTALPEDWIYAVIRQESVFNPTVVSPVGALGLMQLMPGTARDLAGDLGIAAPDPAAIVEPPLNISLGSAYLAQMRDRFGHAALATAAYNAGPRRVAQWLPEQCTEADLWIAAIPFDETRGYVERVLAYRAIYRARLGLDPVRLSDLLPPVGRDHRRAGVGGRPDPS
ncbi:MAG TPA: transglycosylase SLT domain-containing protein [Lamprocystis sp. (in: g-proteobacteria)]|nr:transglycosylase SLT domain-containing protein [Lamprocystis sp. (in: g-proteobacteria)]